MPYKDPKKKGEYDHQRQGGDPERFKRIQKAYDYLKKVKGG